MDKPMPANHLRTRRPPVPRALPARPKRRAQATVEFALVAPLLFALVFGIFEFGWLFRSHMTVHFATREGARTGAVAGTVGDADAQIQQAVDNSMIGMSYADIIELSIYHADTAGNCVPDPGSGLCQEDAYAPDANGDWVALPGRLNWPATTNRRDNEPTDILAVRIQYRHHFLINFLPGAVGDTIIDDRSVMNIEPAQFLLTPTP